METKNVMTAEMLFESAKVMLELKKYPYRIFTDIPYSGGSEYQKLDIALPAEGGGPFPVVVFIHGGGWYYGDKHNVHTTVAWDNIPPAGFALVSVNYRLTTEASWPAQIYDCKAAIRYIRAHAAEYKLDANRIAVWGNSAGGQLSAVLAATNGNPDYEDPAMGCTNESSAVQAACIWYGIFDFTAFEGMWKRILKPGMTRAEEGYDATGKLLSGKAAAANKNAVHASAKYQVHADMPPMFLMHGTSDNVVPYLQSVEFFERYLQCNDHKKIHLELIEGAGHGGPDFWSNVPKMLEFLKRNLV